VAMLVSPTATDTASARGSYGDGRMDIITPKGWFESSPDPRNASGLPFGIRLERPDSSTRMDGRRRFAGPRSQSRPRLRNLLVRKKKDAQGNASW